MKRLLWPMVLFIIGGMVLVGCVQSAQTLPTGQVETPAVAVTTSSPTASWEQRWKTVLSEGKQEGTVSIYSLWRPETRVALARAFHDRYGINVESSPFGRGAELAAKIKAEQRAGIYSADVFGAGNTTQLASLKPEGLLGQIEPLLILPEVLDPRAWHGGRIPYSDNDGMALSLIGRLTRNLIYNANLVKEGELTSYKDLLRPQYKGKITLSDPTVSGAGNASLSYLTRVWGETETIDFLRRLLKEQEVLLQRDSRLNVESVARGKYAIAMGPSAEILYEFMELGSPVRIAMTQEDITLTASSGAISVPTKLAHPSATAVFVNWLLTKEGQSIFARSFGSPSTRLDASTEGVNPLFVPAPGGKYFAETEDFHVIQGKWLDIAKTIIAETSR